MGQGEVDSFSVRSAAENKGIGALVRVPSELYVERGAVWNVPSLSQKVV